MLRIGMAFVLGTGVWFAVSNAASADTPREEKEIKAASAASAKATTKGEPGWMGVIVARGELKQWIESTPIVDRPNRPFHFYGNTVRRQYYRGTAVPRPGDLVKGGSAVIVNRAKN